MKLQTPVPIQHPRELAMGAGCILTRTPTRWNLDSGSTRSVFFNVRKGGFAHYLYGKLNVVCAVAKLLLSFLSLILLGLQF